MWFVKNPDTGEWLNTHGGARLSWGPIEQATHWPEQEQAYRMLDMPFVYPAEVVEREVPAVKPAEIADKPSTNVSPIEQLKEQLKAQGLRWPRQQRPVSAPSSQLREQSQAARYTEIFNRLGPYYREWANSEYDLRCLDGTILEPVARALMDRLGRTWRIRARVWGYNQGYRLEFARQTVREPIQTWKWAWGCDHIRLRTRSRQPEVWADRIEQQLFNAWGRHLDNTNNK